jgi:hypothetical protein
MIRYSQIDKSSLFVLGISSGVLDVTAIVLPSPGLKEGSGSGGFRTAGEDN